MPIENATTYRNYKFPFFLSVTTLFGDRPFNANGWSAFFHVGNRNNLFCLSSSFACCAAAAAAQSNAFDAPAAEIVVLGEKGKCCQFVVCVDGDDFGASSTRPPPPPLTVLRN